ncbi:glycosyltransferase family 2 protein [Thermostaphylospora chromogena]|uniref:Glycosyl transferase family 2 n=1 Tax=Thermostaphylospora chromogena TaxID=35622 RepID=A0A1H1E8Z9_9ACTN|nr:glycosyltransferase family 2 protein [Thermostaphylospora chromogena]SDQ85242.1 Glycosyl transferase family 2 [Thermostaphylospora chromogena]
MSRPLLSVVVPFHDVEKYIEPCLDSIAAQDVDGMEVICVADGARDGSVEAVRARAAVDPRFHLVEQPRRGPGPAKQTGVDRSSGRYLAFVNGDDIVPPGAFALMVASLEETGSDLACGNVLRLAGDRLVGSRPHRRVFRVSAPRTHIRRHPALLRDRILGNKIFRRDFWDRHGLTFPARWYEDRPVTVMAHVLAGAVDVLSEVVYHWRDHAVADPAAALRRMEPARLRDRLTAILDTAAFLDTHAPALKPSLDVESMRVDLRVVAEAVPDLAEADREAVLDLARRYLRGVAADVWREVPALTRLELRLLQNGMIEEIGRVLDVRRSTGEPVRVRPRGVLRRRWIADYPLRDDRRLPRDCHDVTEELTLDAEADRITWRRERLEAVIRVRVPGVAPADLCGGRLRLFLRQDPPAAQGPPVEGDHGSCVGEWRLTESGPTVVTADLTDVLAHGDGMREGVWRLHAELAARGLRLAATVHAPADPLGAWGPLRVGDGLWLIPAAGAGRRLKLRVRRAKAAVTACVFTPAGIAVSGWIRGSTVGEAAVLARGGEERLLSFPARLWRGTDGGVRFEAVVPVHAVGFPGGAGWRLSLQRGDDPPVPLALDITSHLSGTVGHRRFVVTRSAHCHVVLRERIEG